ncbi:hypothetical protein [Kribbella sp. NPDC000426]|uniref:hypothetical protein n=1 Tax=Kribbella sp. NPDC000426 TaxID=3154255 RepID=UPI00333081AA
MSSDDDIFFSGGAVEDVAEWMARTLGLERLESPDLEEGEYLFKKQSRFTDGLGVLLLVRPNIHLVVDPEPDEVSVIDGCTGMAKVRLAGVKDVQAQTREACTIFSELAATAPRVALVLTNALSTVVAAYRPGAGVRSFPAGTSMDLDDIGVWRPWVGGGPHGG